MELLQHVATWKHVLSGLKSSLDYKTQFNTVLFYNSCLKVLCIARKEPTNFPKKKAQQSHWSKHLAIMGRKKLPFNRKSNKYLVKGIQFTAFLFVICKGEQGSTLLSETNKKLFQLYVYLMVQTVDGLTVFCSFYVYPDEGYRSNTLVK